MIEDLQDLERKVGELVQGRTSLRVLEAGCGSISRIQFPLPIRVTGMDISREQLDKNDLLEKKILHDIQVGPYPDVGFDVVVCWDVLEHLPNPVKALRNFISVVNQEGLIILASPNVMSLRGLVAKFTPHWFHVLFYRYVYGHKDAGKPGMWPFKSYHRFAMSPHAIRRFAQKSGFEIPFLRIYEIENPEKKNRAFNALWTVANGVVNVLTFGSVATDKGESFIIVLRKPLNGSAPDRS